MEKGSCLAWVKQQRHLKDYISIQTFYQFCFQHHFGAPWYSKSFNLMGLGEGLLITVGLYSAWSLGHTSADIQAWLCDLGQVYLTSLCFISKIRVQTLALLGTLWVNTLRPSAFFVLVVFGHFFFFFLILCYPSSEVWGDCRVTCMCAFRNMKPQDSVTFFPCSSRQLPSGTHTPAWTHGDTSGQSLAVVSSVLDRSGISCWCDI